MKRQIICKILTGAHLYGTDHALSDTDYKGVYMPTHEELMLGTYPEFYSESTGDKSRKNTKEDIDCDFYSIQRFVSMCKGGDPMAFDMLFAKGDAVIQTTPMWDRITQNPSRFFTKGLDKFVKYAYSQSMLYSAKGDRVRELKEVIDFLSLLPVKSKIGDFVSTLPLGKYRKWVTMDLLTFYEVLGKKYQSTLSVDNALVSLEKSYNEYGARALNAADNDSKDWKAISHSLRACESAVQLYTNGCISFPLPNADFLRDVKLGKVDFLTGVQPVIIENMERLAQLKEECDYPEVIDVELIDFHFSHLIFQFYEGVYND